MKIHGILQCFRSDDKAQPRKEIFQRPVFNEKNEYLGKNGETLLQERISLFDGRTNPVRCLSVGDLKAMNADDDQTFQLGGLCHHFYAGIWDGTTVLVKVFRDEELSKLACREIAVAMQMATHKNVHRLLGCCLDTNYPVLVYQWAKKGTLQEQIFRCKEESKQPLEWKDRLRIAWEISHAVAYLHTAFRRPIIHRDLKPKNVFLDQDGSARLSDFSLSISIPEGKMHVEDDVKGTFGYLAPEYLEFGEVAESSDVFGFGVLLLGLLTGKPAVILSEPYPDGLVNVVSACLAANCLGDIIDPSIVTNGTADEHFQHQLEAAVELALRCSAEDVDRRPTMVDVATQLKMISSWSDSM